MLARSVLRVLLASPNPTPGLLGLGLAYRVLRVLLGNLGEPLQLLLRAAPRLGRVRARVRARARAG
eukprot:scaffold115875_cov27-Phaeocystis_antarctica.AAC.1